MSEHKVGSANTLLQNGQMKRVELEGTGIILARVEGQYYAFGGTCTHYGAPLDEGVLKGHSLMCPWHHACFDIRSGMRLEPPALNDLPHYPVRIEGGEVVVTLPQDNEAEPQGKADPGDKRTIVIVGGGSAGNAAAEELRREGYHGKITIISAVPNVPVDRPNLSKDYLAGTADPAWMPLRGDKSWYDARGIELRLDTKVARIDPKGHTVQLDKGGSLHYDKLLLATGGTPRHLTNVPGADLKGIYTLRTLADADKIIEAAQDGKRAVVIGASFIGMEVAASLVAGRKAHVTVVAPEVVPFEHILGKEIGLMFQQEHERQGVNFRLNDQVNRFVGAGGHVTGVEVKDDQMLAADFVVVGIGVTPATDFLKDSGLKMDDKDHSVRVSAYLQSRDPDIYAAGDIARFDDGTEKGTRIEHWRTAEQEGIVAARNMLGRTEDMNHHVPFFWTTQFKIDLRYVGHATRWDEIIYRYGEPQQKNFVAFYIAGGKLQAAAGLGHDAEMDAIELILRDRLPLTLQQMRDESFDLIAYAQGGHMPARQA